MKEKSGLSAQLEEYQKLKSLVSDVTAALELLDDSADAELERELVSSLKNLESILVSQEFVCKMRGEFDRSGAIIEINAGSGGTEAQDWAAMIQRMYSRWAENKGFSIEELDSSPGEQAGVKSVTLLIEGDFAYGHLRSEQGVHRLVRISPFDSAARRHTSFASVAVTPDIEEEIDIEVNEADLRIDTFRASGAGGQHVNKTDSAVRMTHIPSGIVVAVQSERSQHKNRARAMKTLKAKLFELERQAQNAKMAQLKGERKSIDFGSQIRSYVLQPYQMIKDLRTNYESSNVTAVLDGAIDEFIESYLLSDCNQG